MVLGAAHRLHALAVLRGGLVHVPRDRRGADEADGLHARVGEERVDGFGVAVEHVEDARRTTGLGEQLGEPERAATGRAPTA